jgi:AcrR family transcriptional regulator
MMKVVAERGYPDATLESVVAQAQVSRRTFYRCFEHRDACFQELIDLASARMLDIVASAFARERAWQDGVRSALASWLAFLDSEPLLARVWLVESLAAGAWALERRERDLAALHALTIARWPAAAAGSPSSLAVEGATASVIGVLQTHIVTGRPGPLIGLLGPLAGLVAAQYLPPHLVAREIERGEELLRTNPVSWPPIRASMKIPALLSNPNSHRARRCVLFLADRPQASNREIAVAIGVAHESQISKLLASLFTERLVAKRSLGVGRRNAWCLTPRGEEISQALPADEEAQVAFGANMSDCSPPVPVKSTLEAAAHVNTAHGDWRKPINS